MSAWESVPYPKISESPGEWQLDLASQRQLDRQTWVVSEKLHGANFGFATDGSELRCAKRKAWLEPGDPFFGYATLRDELAARVLAAFAQLRAQRPELRRLDVCGELFGGAYPHPDVPAVAGLQAVQTGVYYAPGLCFAAFDLRTWEDEGPPRFLGWGELCAVCDSVELPRAPELARGSLREAQEVPLDALVTTWPARLGLPALPGNLAEGVVVRPLEELVLPTPRGPRRALFKRKPPRFSEDPRYHQARKPPARAGADPGSYALELLTWRVEELVNPNRLAAARSKVGRAESGAERAEVAALLREDVLEVLEHEHAAELAALDLTARELLEAHLDDEVERSLCDSSGDSVS